jgi:hypothetical protein
VKDTIKGLLSLGVMTAVVVAVLMAVNRFPLAIEEGLMREYASIEEVEKVLGIRPVYVPSFFPENVAWPPLFVIAQNKPYEAVAIEFGSRDGGPSPLLVITQSVSEGFRPSGRLMMDTVAESSTFDLKGRPAELEAGTCAGERICSMLSWTEGPYHIRVQMQGGPFSLIRMAESMVRTPEERNSPE